MVNDLGVDPYEWFETKYTNPLDSMPIATDTPFQLIDTHLQKK